MSAGNNAATKSHRNLGQSGTDQRGKASRARVDKSVKGKLNMRSPAGLFIVFGLLIVVVGIAIAVVGYWPRKHNSQALASQQRRNSSESAAEIQRARARLQPQPVQKNEKLKLIGPLIMGIGLFVFICANTVLHENRDRETRLLVRQNTYPVAGQTGSEESNEPEGGRHNPAPSCADAGFGCSELCCAAEGGCGATCPIHAPSAETWADSRKAARRNMTAQLLHHKRPSPSTSLCSVTSDSCNSSEGNLNVPLSCGDDSSVVSASIVLPVIKLNNCVIDAPVAKAAVEDIEVGHPAVMTSTEDLSKLKSHGCVRSGSIRSADGALSVIGADHPLQEDSFPNRSIGGLLSPGAARKAYASDLQLHTLGGHSKSLDLGRNADKLGGQRKERQHRSWPRLDCSYIKKYLKLENRGDGVDRLLEQTEREFGGEEQNL
ncbi:transmembrane protein 200A-like [Hemitrygon akajei]|uniref:transmembrane protein 200A-like n=1 Tax=Hemitrygon akajei TaxID=2704970 RepID=UPI003BF9459F